jgi:hypothetical protein
MSGQRHNQGETYGFPLNPIPYLLKTDYSTQIIQNILFKIKRMGFKGKPWVSPEKLKSFL